ncbi:MAG TPA: FkbM family methyltransferase [Nanoarchaeota archaeon]|nr:FkbM family methyltransferase [Nanoarchaeota archaeon]
MLSIIRTAQKVIWRLKGPILTRINGYELWFWKDHGAISAALLKGISPNLREAELIKKTVKAGDTVVDVGAHIGSVTILLSRLVGDSGKVYAFEPHPDNFKLLLRNIALNECKNIIAIHGAVSNTDGELNLYVDAQYDTGHAIWNTGNRKSIRVKAVALDTYFSAVPKIDFLKIDVQGAEGLIFKHSKETLKKCSNIMTEFYPNGLWEMGTGSAEFIKLLENAGFEITDVDKYNLYCRKK